MDKKNDGLEKILHDIEASDLDKNQRIRIGCIAAWRCLTYRPEDKEDLRFYVDGILRAITGQKNV